MATIFVKMCQKKNRTDLIPIATGLGLVLDVVIVYLFLML